MSRGGGSAARRRSREAALQVLYALDLARQAGSARPEDQPPGSDRPPAPEQEPPLDVEAAFARVTAHFDLPEGARAFAKELACGVARELAGLDAAIAAHSRNWRVDRMAVVDRNILRLGAYELLHTDVPHNVAIDEAVDLAHRFGSDTTPAFVNGILDAIARSRHPDA